MDMTATVHAVAAIASTSRELAELWRLLTGSGPTVTVSGRILAVAWMSANGPYVRARSHLSAGDLDDLLWALNREPTMRFLLVEHRKRVKMIVLQHRDEIAGGQVVRPSEGSPLIVTCACAPECMERRAAP
jgi:hypothetical protein